ncbi:MAG: hypothetical protein A4E65_02130 [Syntrophorhabdus sp. PtaU1.Bin153]|nr:MAG: hypothetical protein A4E65_02130 [Syntrophorhabdus sp. PtaU1.Bin153]
MTGQVGSLSSERNSRRNAIISLVLKSVFAYDIPTQMLMPTKNRSKKRAGNTSPALSVFYAALADFLSFCNQIVNDVRLCQG